MNSLELCKTFMYLTTREFETWLRRFSPLDSFGKCRGPLAQSNVKTTLIVFISVSDSSSAERDNARSRYLKRIFKTFPPRQI